MFSPVPSRPGIIGDAALSTPMRFQGTPPTHNQAAHLQSAPFSRPSNPLQAASSPSKLFDIAGQRMLQLARKAAHLFNQQ